jgi:nicotinamidase-related amidase
MIFRFEGVDAMAGSSKPIYDAWKVSVLSKIDPRRTAMLLIDLQKDFCSAEGALALLGSDVSASGATAERIAQFLPSVRAAVGLVAFFRLVYDPVKMSEAQKERLLRDGRPIICAPGNSGADLIIAPAQGDRTFVKHRYSAFSNQQFRDLLCEHSITTVAVAGVDTHICVEGTVRHGYDLGYRMVVLSDLVATRKSEIGRHENSLALCERYFALTIESSTFLEICQSNRKGLAAKAD